MQIETQATWIGLAPNQEGPGFPKSQESFQAPPTCEGNAEPGSVSQNVCRIKMPPMLSWIMIEH